MTPGQDWNELHLSEDPAVEVLEAIGYTCVAPEVLEAEREFRKEIGTLAGSVSRADSVGARALFVRPAAVRGFLVVATSCIPSHPSWKYPGRPPRMLSTADRR